MFLEGDVLGSAVAISLALEIGLGWHLAAWRSPFLYLVEVIGSGVIWFIVEVSAAAYGIIFSATAVILFGIDFGHPTSKYNYLPPDMAPLGKAIVVCGTLALTATVWRVRLWVAQRDEQGFSGWQTLLAALRAVFSAALNQVSRLQLLMTGLIGLVGGGLLLWMLANYVPPDALASAWPWLRWCFVAGFILITMHFLSIIVGGLAKAVEAVRFRPTLQEDSHGQARTAWQSELRRASLSPHKNGIYLGAFVNPHQPKQRCDRVEYPEGVHLVTIGRTGSGKGTGLIIPNLSTLRRSIIIIDPKGEAAAITARKRAKFGRVVMLNPFNLLAEDRPWMQSEGFNPLASVRSDENFLDDCTIIGQSLVKQELSGNGRFFSGSAHDLVTAFVVHELLTKRAKRERPSLANVRTMLTEPWGGNEKDGPSGIAKTILDMTLSSYDPLRAKAGRFKTVSNSTRDVISTAVNETSFIDSPPVANDLASASDFRFADMKNQIVTVYLVLPATHLESHSNWLRLVIASALRELLATPANPAMPPVLFMLDEFAQLSHLPAISNAMNIARSFGVQLWPFVQDLNQLHNIYRDSWENFLGASAVLTAFAPNDLFTSDHLSKRCGNKTIIVESENERSGASGMGRGRGPQSAPLFRPEELRGMPPGQMLCFVDPVKNPFLARAPGYWESDFNVGLDPNPYHQG